MVKRSVSRGPARIPDYKPPPVIRYSPEQIISARVQGWYTFLAPIKCRLEKFHIRSLEEEDIGVSYSSPGMEKEETLVAKPGSNPYPILVTLEPGEVFILRSEEPITLAFTARTTHDAPETILQRITDQGS
jgi:hypothetical protein